jgi:hypothetical protein
MGYNGDKTMVPPPYNWMMGKSTRKLSLCIYRYIFLEVRNMVSKFSLEPLH